MSKYPLSDKFISWASGLSALCTEVRSTHGSMAELVQEDEWDGDKTALVLNLLRGLKVSVARMEKELRSHVESIG